MHIYTRGRASKDFAPDLIEARVTFNTHAMTYKEALETGVKKVNEYIAMICERTDFQPEDFKTNAYSIVEHFHTNRIDAKTIEDLDKKLEKRVSDGFFFTQYAHLSFDYDRDRLIRLIAATPAESHTPYFHFNFTMKSYDDCRNQLISEAYKNAQAKAQSLADAAGKHLRDCIDVHLDDISTGASGYYGDVMYEKSANYKMARESSEIENRIQAINENFHPDDINISREISCVWETSD